MSLLKAMIHSPLIRVLSQRVQRYRIPSDCCRVSLIASLKVFSHQGQAVTIASAPVDAASSILSLAVHLGKLGIGFADAAAGAAAPGVFLDPGHLGEFQPGNAL